MKMHFLLASSLVALTAVAQAHPNEGAPAPAPVAQPAPVVVADPDAALMPIEASMVKVDSDEGNTILRALMESGQGQTFICTDIAENGKVSKSPATLNGDFQITSAYRSTAGQPVLRLDQVSDSDASITFITTDASNTRVIGFKEYGFVKTDDRQQNIGTITNPNYVTIPGSWVATTTSDCRTK